MLSKNYYVIKRIKSKQTFVLASPVYYCRDESDGSEYPPGNNFRRSSDNYLCNCTVSRTDEGYFNSRLECIAPVETKTNYNVQRVDPGIVNINFSIKLLKRFKVFESTIILI